MKKFLCLLLCALLAAGCSSRSGTGSSQSSAPAAPANISSAVPAQKPAAPASAPQSSSEGSGEPEKEAPRWYASAYDVDWQYQNWLYLDGEHSFELTVNLYAGMGTVKGDYVREDGGSIAFEIKNKSFNGFAGDDATGFRAQENSDGALVYSGGAIGMLAENTVFYPMDGGPEQVTARPEDLPAQTVYPDEQQLEEQKELEDMQNVREQAAELARSIGGQTNEQGERLYTITYVVVSASGDTQTNEQTYTEDELPTYEQVVNNLSPYLSADISADVVMLSRADGKADVYLAAGSAPQNMPRELLDAGVDRTMYEKAVLCSIMYTLRDNYGVNDFMIYSDNKPYDSPGWWDFVEEPYLLK